MSENQLNLSIFFVFATMIASVGTAIFCLVKMFLNKRRPEKTKKAGISSALLLSAALLLSVWSMKLAVGGLGIGNATEIQDLSFVERVVYSLLSALRTFGVEEGYADFIVGIKELVSNVIPESHWGYGALRFIMAFYASAVVLLAPVLGGAIILEILSSVFPRIELICSYVKVWRSKYFFSELNAASLSLAKSIYYQKKFFKPIFVFTDTYVDRDKEKEYELLLEAKQYGAICVRDDLAHVAKPWFGKREYYLLDENEFANLQTLMGLTEKQNIKRIKNSYIYLFVQSDAYVQVEKKVNKKFASEKKLGFGKKKPTIVPVQGFKNLVHNLFLDVPLYEPLVHKNDPTKLTVTILGNGIIGTEAFLSAYWFGQLMISGNDKNAPTMTECDLTINVVSKDTEEVFWSKIDYVNPEIRDTVNLIESSLENSSGKTLIVDQKGTKNNPYCSVKYTQADVKIGGFWNDEMKKLLSSDYFIIALGNDADNISIAERLRRAVGKMHFESDASDVKNTVIAYAVFDSELAGMLNSQKRYQTRSKEKTDIYMHAFGSLDQVYSCENVYMSKSSILAEETGNVYRKAQTKLNHISENKGRAQSENSDYNYWANIARASHIKYKVFSLGWLKTSLFDYTTDTLKISEKTEEIVCEEQNCEKCKLVSTDCYHRDIVKSVCEEYKRVAISNSISDDDTRGKSDKKDIEGKKHCLAWLEHRRWNAFTRVMGYQYEDAKNILDIRNSQKDMELKLHSCLVEARRPAKCPDDPYIYAEFLENGKVDEETAFVDFESKSLDLLDEASYERKKRKPQESVDDYKMYDYYRYEFDNYLNADEAAKLLKKSKRKVIRRCEKGKYKGAVWFKEFSEWHIPVDSLKSKK